MLARSALFAVLLVGCQAEDGSSWTPTGSVDPGPDCGNGIVDAGEQCDDGESNADDVADACRSSCIAPACGDEVVDSEEDCDDGGRWGGDGCDASCQTESGQLEGDDNDDPLSPQDWEGGTVHGGLPEGDRDCFGVELTSCQAVEARLQGPCDDPARIGLFSPSGAEVAASSTDSEGCAWLDPADSPGARFVVEEGTWSICLTGQLGAEVADYALDIEVIEPEPELFPVDPDEDLDGDGLPASCDDDVDGDGVLDEEDNCPGVPNGEDSGRFEVTAGGWITTWLAAAPFTGNSSTDTCKPTELDLVSEDDSQVSPSLGEEAGETAWRTLSSSGAHVDFNLEWGDVGAPREIYLAVHVRAPEAQEATFAYGPDDGARVWFEQAWLSETTACQGVSADRYQESVALSGDWQPLVMKIYDQGGGWGTYARFLDADGAGLEGVELSLLAGGDTLESQLDTDGDGAGDLCDETPNGDAVEDTGG